MVEVDYKLPHDETLYESALLHLLQDTEGVCVVVEEHKYFVYKCGDEMCIMPAEEVELEPGQLIWMHIGEDGNAIH